MLSDEPDAVGERLQKVAADQGLSGLPLTVYKNRSGPSEYRLADDFATTILMWHKNVVTANHSFRTAQLSDGDVANVIADVRDLVD